MPRRRVQYVGEALNFAPRDCFLEELLPYPNVDSDNTASATRSTLPHGLHVDVSRISAPHARGYLLLLSKNSTGMPNTAVGQEVSLILIGYRQLTSGVSYIGTTCATSLLRTFPPPETCSSAPNFMIRFVLCHPFLLRFHLYA